MADERKPIAIVLNIAVHLFVHSVSAAIVLLVVCPVAGVYIAFFERTEALLPALTLLLVEISWFLSAFWFLVFPFLGLLDCGVVLVIGLSKTRHNLLGYWTIVVLLLTVLFLTFCHIAFSVPLHELSAPHANEVETAQ